MTNHTVIPSVREKHADSIPAMQAAFAIGRARYLSLKAWEDGGGLVRVQNALSPAKKKTIIGGGSTNLGKVKWLIENQPGITAKEIGIVLQLGHASVHRIVSQLLDENLVSREKKVKPAWQRMASWGYRKHEVVVA